MARVLDLTEIMDEQHKRFYLGEALLTEFDLWDRYSDEESDARETNFSRTRKTLSQIHGMSIISTVKY
jgi:hypothetical protein